MSEKYCEFCGKSLKGMRDYYRRRFCSQQCFGKLRQTQAISPNSGRKRAQKLFKMKTCLKCGDTQNLQRHHKDGNPLNNDPLNVGILCRVCHKNIHVSNGTWSTGPAKLNTCSVCGKQFNAKDHRNRANKICSAKCLSEWGSLCAMKR